MTNKQKRAKQQSIRRKIKQNIATMISISLVVCVLLGVLLWQSSILKSKISTNQQKQENLTAEIEDEQDRTEEIENLEEYMQSDEYIEQMAREKAGLVKDNEIIFKESN